MRVCTTMAMRLLARTCIGVFVSSADGFPSSLTGTIARSFPALSSNIPLAAPAKARADSCLHSFSMRARKRSSKRGSSAALNAARIESSSPFMPRRNSDSARRAAGSLLLAANVALLKLSSTCKNCAQRSTYASTCNGFRLPSTGSELWQGEESPCMLLTAGIADS